MIRDACGPRFCGRKVLSTALLACLLMAGTSPPQAAGQLAPPRAADSDLTQAEALSVAFRRAAHAILPAVVKIESTVKERRIIRRGLPREEDFFGNPLEEFFGPGFRGRLEQRMPRQEGMGSGVIIRADGLILTNNHVVDGADILTVELSDGRSVKAEDVRVDPETDIAILRIKGFDDLTHARLGDSDVLDIGDWVLAVGNPFSLEASVSAGIISAKGRSLDSASRASFLQTDAAINPGNSGGPLVNLRGEVIGINTAIASSSGGYQGIGFAVPINQAKWVIEQLLEKGEVERAWLGIGIAALDQSTARALHIESRVKGVFVEQVTSHSPAEQAGMLPGDVILQFNHQSVANPAELQRAVERTPMHSVQPVTVLRKGETIELRVKTEPLPKQATKSARRRPLEENEDESDNEQIDVPVEDLGLQVADMTRDIARELGYPLTTSGVVVVRVLGEGMAARSGLRLGMIIVSVNSRPIHTAEELENALTNADFTTGVPVGVTIPGKGDRLLILRQRQ